MAESFIDWADDPIEEIRTVVPIAIGNRTDEETTYVYNGILRDGTRISLARFGNRLPDVIEAPHLATDVIVWGPPPTGRRAINLGD